MRWNEVGLQPCSVARSLAVVGDRWTLLLLRDCFLGVRRFEAFQARLGIARGLVADRLRLLVEEGVLRREAYQARPLRQEYRLTDKGLDLYPVVMSLVRWGNAYYGGEEGAPVLHRHRACGHDFEAACVCGACGEAIDPKDVEVRAGVGFPDPLEPFRAASAPPAQSRPLRRRQGLRRRALGPPGRGPTDEPA